MDSLFFFFVFFCMGFTNGSYAVLVSAVRWNGKSGRTQRAYKAEAAQRARKGNLKVACFHAGLDI